MATNRASLLVFAGAVAFASWARSQDGARPAVRAPTKVAPDDDSIRGDHRILVGPRSAAVSQSYRATYAVIVGINAYPGTSPGLPPLEFALNDARELRELLRDEFGYVDQRTRFLIDGEAT